FMGGTNGLAPVIGDVAPASAGDSAGLRAGDEIVAIDGVGTATWQDVRLALLERLGETGTIELQLKHMDDGTLRSAAVPVTNWLGDTDAPDLLGDLGLVPFHLVVEPRLQ